LLDNNILNGSQYGFVDGKSIIEQMMVCMHNWNSALMERSELHCIYFDISKAFDTVSHLKLIYKLRCLGFCPVLVNWLTAYLFGRSFVVRVNNCLSNKHAVLPGVPQGSTLGPLLFVIYVNDLFSVVKNSTMLMFADDCKLLNIIHNDNDKLLLQTDIDAVCLWYALWQFKPNIDKTVFLALFKRALSNYTAGNALISACNNVTDLGLLYDCNINFRCHIANITRRAHFLVHNMFLMFKNHDRKFYVHLYVTFVRPILEFCTPVWSPQLVQDIECIENVQRSFTRRICRDMSYSERLSCLHLKSLEERRVVFDLMYFFNMRSNANNTLFNDYFAPFNSPRYVNCYRVLYTNMSLVKRLWFHRVITYWNFLPTNVKLAPSYSAFCNHLSECNFNVFLRAARA